MTSFRRQLRAWAMVWTLFQAASLAALAPQTCCATHTADSHARADAEPCHEPPAAVHCPMRGADGAPCPMHAGAATHETSDAPRVAAHAGHASPATTTPAAADDCVMRAACKGPAPFTLLSQGGIVPATTATAAPSPTLVSSLPFAPASPELPAVAPDPRPPRA